MINLQAIRQEVMSNLMIRSIAKRRDAVASADTTRQEMYSVMQRSTFRWTSVVAAALAVLAMPGSSFAHHAFGAEFDPNRPLVLRGPITKVEWVNPHAWIHLEHTNEAGEKEAWMVEGGTPNTLLRRGFNKKSLKIGTVIVVDGYQSKDLSQRANGRDVTFTDGRKLFLGSSGTGAPRDGKDPTER